MIEKEQEKCAAEVRDSRIDGGKPFDWGLPFRKKLEQWEKEHRELLWKIASENFMVLHYGAAAELTVKKEELYVPGDKAGAGGVAEAAPSEKAPE